MKFIDKTEKQFGIQFEKDKVMNKDFIKNDKMLLARINAERDFFRFHEFWTKIEMSPEELSKNLEASLSKINPETVEVLRKDLMRRIKPPQGQRINFPMRNYGI